VHAVSQNYRKKMSPITFTNSDFLGVDPEQDDPMVITTEMKSFTPKKILIDQSSSVDILEDLQEAPTLGGCDDSLL